MTAGNYKRACFDIRRSDSLQGGLKLKNTLQYRYEGPGILDASWILRASLAAMLRCMWMKGSR